MIILGSKKKKNKHGKKKHKKDRDERRNKNPRNNYNNEMTTPSYTYGQKQMTTNTYSNDYEPSREKNDFTGVPYNTNYNNYNSNGQDSYESQREQKTYQTKNYYGRSNIQWENSLRGSVMKLNDKTCVAHSIVPGSYKIFITAGSENSSEILDLAPRARSECENSLIFVPLAT